MSILKLSIKHDSNITKANRLILELKDKKELSFQDFKNLLEIAHSLLETKIEESDSYNLALSIICHACEYCPKDRFLKQLIFDCISASRVFLYNDMIIKRDKNFAEEISDSIFNDFSQAYYTLETETILTKEQKALFEAFQEKKRIIVSAPTSFGKSRIIQEIIALNNYKNIAIVLPTIALLNETFTKFKNNKLIESYKLINSINALNLGEKNIFILTPEKMDLLLDQAPDLIIDFFIMDEIYKIQDDAERRTIFTNCLYRLTKHNADFYLIGPYFNSFSNRFLEATNAYFLKYDGEIVQKDTFDLSKISIGETFKINNKVFKKLKSKDRNFLNILSGLTEQTLVYIGRKDSVETRAKKISENIGNEVSNDLIDYIQENIAEDWSLVTCLKKGVGFHHSAIPKYIQSEIVDAFNDGAISTIVCTSTLTEGVNTSAKNVIIYDNFKGINELTGFDVKNIKGRAGRFYVHFLGNVFSLEKLKIDADLDNIEFSYYDTERLESEEVIQVDKSELKNENLKLREHIENELKTVNVPFSLVKNNKFIPIQKQILLIEYLRNNFSIVHDVYFDGQLPDKSHLDLIMKLCHEYLFNVSDHDNKNFFIWELIKQTKYYIYKSPSIKLLIANQKGAKSDTKIRHAFSLLSHFFEFALPKYFTAFQNIYNFVVNENDSKKEISLAYLITRLEFGFTTSHEIALKEAGLPNDIIGKVARLFQDCLSIEEIRAKLRFNPFLLNILTDFETKIFNKYI